MDGFIGGGQAGYNWQTGNWVWGFEGDLQWSDEKGSARFLCAATIIAGPCLPGLTFLPPGVTGTSLILDQHLEWFGTLRARGGILANPQTLLYVTGGLAYGSIKSTGTLTATMPMAPPSLRSPATAKCAQAGRSASAPSSCSPGTGAARSNTSIWISAASTTPSRWRRWPRSAANTSSRFTDHIARVGINYHFNQPVVAKY